jgi:Domain of Unknown Function (DUF748)
MHVALHKRWQRWVLFFGLGILSVWVISWLALPKLLAWQIEKQGTQLLGRAVTVAQVLVRPWSMRLIVRGLRVAHADADLQSGAATPSAQLSVDEVEINASMQSLFLWAPVADAVWVRHPQLQLSHRGQGRFDIDDVLARFASTPSQGAGFPRLSLFNIQWVGGGVQFRDEPKGVTHTLRDVHLNIPFLSNIGGRREVLTHPRLAFVFNGAAFDTDAATAPFAADRRTQAHFHVQGLDIKPYLPYWPADWPVRWTDGRLEMDIRVDFRQQTRPELALSGHVALRDLKLQEKHKDSHLNLLQLGAVDLKIETWRPLEGVFKLSQLSLDKPWVHLRREAGGELNWARLRRAFGPAQRADGTPVQVGIDGVLKDFQIKGGQLHWQDDTLVAPAMWAVNDLAFEAQNLSWPNRQMADFRGQADLEGAIFSWTGMTDLHSAQMDVRWRDLSLKTAAPYWATRLRPGLSGQSSAQLQVDWRVAEADTPASLQLKAAQIRVSDGRLGSSDKPELSWAELKLEQVEVDVFKQRVHVGRVDWHRPFLTVTRDPQGHWMWHDWWVQAPARHSPEPSAMPWQLGMGPVQISAGLLTVDDRFVPGGAQWQAGDVKVSMGAWQPLAASPQMTSLQVALTMGAQQRRGVGQLDFEGGFRAPFAATETSPAMPLQLKGNLKLAQFPLQALRSYWAHRLNADVKKADLSYVGGLDLAMPDAGLSLHLLGKLSLDQLHALTPSDGEVLLDIQSLALQGVDLKVDQGVLRSMKTSQATLSDFFARLAVDAQGHFNLQNLLKTDPLPASSPPSSLSTHEPPEPATMVWGPVQVAHGRILFSDHFIQPPYLADITDLMGSLGPSSNAPEPTDKAPANLNLRGRVAGSGSLEVSGHINPLTRPVVLDIQGRLRDLELPQLSPYSSKYAGYGIERGKLSAEVNYRLGADGRLQAAHQIMLNQLRLGERSTSPEASTLPVKLALALLADRDGLVDIHLPVSGSVLDPDFHVGAIVWQMILNLVGKALTSPFSLISAGLAAPDQLQQIDFMPASPELDVASILKLQNVAQWMIDKPALNLTLVGQANLDSERDAWRSAKLREALVAEKRQRMPLDTQGALPLSDISVEDYPTLLAAVYRRSPIPKSRHFLGLLKDLPNTEMEALLLAAVTVDEANMRALAQARAQTVREVLLSLKVPSARLFVGAPRVTQASTAASFVPKVALLLSVD